MKFNYDEGADVLYVTFDNPEPSIGRELDIEGLWAVGMYEDKTDRPTGVTFIAFKQLLLKAMKEIIR